MQIPFDSMEDQDLELMIGLCKASVSCHIGNSLSAALHGSPLGHTHPIKGVAHHPQPELYCCKRPGSLLMTVQSKRHEEL